MVSALDEGVFGFPRDRRDVLLAPADVVVHLRSSYGISKDGTNLISRWADLSKNGYHFIQATATNQPLFVQNGLNGFPLVKHDGVDNFLSLSLAKFNPITIAVVFRVNDSSTKGIFSWASTPLSTTPFILVQRQSGNIRYYLNGNYRLTFAATINTTYLHILQYTGTQWELYINGTLIPLTYGVLGSNAATIFYLGAGYNGYPAVEFAELTIYNRSLSTVERTLLQQVINYDYAIW